MKKITFLLVMLLPLIGMSQTFDFEWQLCIDNAQGSFGKTICMDDSSMLIATEYWDAEGIPNAHYILIQGQQQEVRYMMYHHR